MNRNPLPLLPEPRIATRGSMRLAGISRRHDPADPMAIPRQWEDFGAVLQVMPDRSDMTTWGAMHAPAGEAPHSHYFCGIAVAADTLIAPTLTTIEIAPRLYAIFACQGHISTIGQAWAQVWSDWVPEQPETLAHGATLVERYPPAFDPETGNGGFELWLPLAASPAGGTNN